MIEWKIYYSVGGEITTFSSLDGGIEDAPGTGVQVIVMIDKDHGWMTQTRGDYYVWDDRGDGYRWWGADIVGLIDYFDKAGQWQKVIKGYTVTSKIFEEIFRMAEVDPDFPKKTASRRQERRVDAT